MTKGNLERNNSTPIPVNAYAVVPVIEDDYQQQTYNIASLTTFANLSSNANGCVDPMYSHIRETEGLQWNDLFFQDNDDVIAVFDFDYPTMESYYRKISWTAYGSTILCGGIFWTGFFLGVPCYLNRNIKWNIRNQHVAITRDGIMFVHDQRPSCWGLPCSDINKSVTFIRYDDIVDCKVTTATINGWTICLDCPMDIVAIESKDNRNDYKTLSLTGLKNVYGFQNLVLAMKQNYCATSTATASTMNSNTETRIADAMNRVVSVNASTSGPSMERGATPTTNGEQEDVATILREIRNELRQHNALLQSVQSNPSPSAPVATIIE